LTSQPTVDPDDSGIILEVKLSVLVREQAEGGAQICGLQAVVFITVKKSHGQLTSEGKGSEFLTDFGIALPRTGRSGDLISEKPYLRCRFGEPDSVHGFQSIASWKKVDDEYGRIWTSQALENAFSKKSIHGLRFPRDQVVTRFKIEIILTPLQWHFLRALEAKYSDPVSLKALAQKVWPACDREPPLTPYEAIHQLVSRLNPKLEELKLEIKTTGSQSYRLMDLAKPKRASA